MLGIIRKDTILWGSKRVRVPVHGRVENAMIPSNTLCIVFYSDTSMSHVVCDNGKMGWIYSYNISPCC